MRALSIAFAVAIALGGAGGACAFQGKVVGIADGDTLTVMDQRQPVRVRLVAIDAPEHGQPYGQRARASLAELAQGKVATVEERGRDVYGRVLARVSVGGIDLNAEQVRRGYAWVFRRFSNDATLLALETEARAARRGLWSASDPVPPWTWRERHPPVRDGDTRGITRAATTMP